MRRKILQMAVLVAVGLAFSVVVSAQTETCPVGLTCFSQADADRISTELAASKAKDKVIAAQDERARLQTELVKAKDDLIEQQKMTLAAQQETIIRLTEIKCSRGSVLFFLIKWKSCN